MSVISQKTGISKEAVIAIVINLVEQLFDEDPKNEEEAEKSVWQFLLGVAPILMTALLARRCWNLTMEELAERRLTLGEDVSLRLDESYWAKLLTTFGAIAVPWFTYRHKRGAPATRTASRSVIPLHPRCHSSTMLLRTETLLGSHAVFSTAEKLLSTLTHGAVTLEDTTIGAHCEIVGGLVERNLMYKPPETIREQLDERATTDQETGLPLLYVSTDAFNLQYYEGATWEAGYRNTHSIRLWYVDKKTGRGVTVGGEFIVGNCEAVEAAFDDLIARGILPADGDYGGVKALLVFVADGMPWFKERLVAKFSEMLVVLDNKHVLTRILNTLKAIFRKGSSRIKEWYRKLCRWVTGRTPGEKKPAGPRATGPNSRPRRRDGEDRAGKRRNYPSWNRADAIEWDLPGHYGGALIAFIESSIQTKAKKHAKILDGLIDYLIERVDDIRYAEFSERGISISSAPIESFHRIAQTRTKLPGQTWTDQKLQAILNLRVVNYLGREPELWGQSDITEQLRSSFDDRLVKITQQKGKMGTTKKKAKSTRVSQKAKMMMVVAS